MTEPILLGLPRNDTKYIVVCGSGTQPHVDVGVSELTKWREGTVKRYLCPFHYVIRRSGEVEHGRQLTMRGHIHKGFNAVSIGICLIGGLNPDDWSKCGDFYEDVQKSSLRALIADLLKRYPGVNVVAQDELGTRFGSTKRINPGFNVQCWLVDVGLKQNPPWWSNGSLQAQYWEKV